MASKFSLEKILYKLAKEIAIKILEFHFFI